MSSSKMISAEQAAQAIALLCSKHDTASGYLYSMDGEGMTRAEFEEYLCTSSQEEYLELLNGHISDECATLVRKAMRLQEKRLAKGQPLLGQRPSKETTKRFFDVLELKKSQSLHLKDVRKAMKALQFSAPLPVTPPPRKQTPSIGAQTVDTTAQADAPSEAKEEAKPETLALVPNSMSKRCEEGAQEAIIEQELRKKRKKERQDAHKMAEADKARKLEARKAKKNDRKKRRTEKELEAPDAQSLTTANVATNNTSKIAEHVAATTESGSPFMDKLQPAAGADQSTSPNLEKKTKKRKRDSTSVVSQAQSASVRAGSEAGLSKSQRKRMKHRARLQEKTVTAAVQVLRNVVRTEGDVQAERITEPSETARALKKQKMAHGSTFDTSASVNAASQSMPPEVAVQRPVEDLTAERADRRQRKSERRNLRRAKLAEDLRNKLGQSSEEAAADQEVEVASNDVDFEHSFPVPTQETTEFVSGVEPENPFNNHSDSDQADTTEMFRIGRTVLPALETKDWTPQSSSPLPRLAQPPSRSESSPGNEGASSRVGDIVSPEDTMASSSPISLSHHSAVRPNVSFSSDLAETHSPQPSHAVAERNDAVIAADNEGEDEIESESDESDSAFSERSRNESYEHVKEHSKSITTSAVSTEPEEQTSRSRTTSKIVRAVRTEGPSFSISREASTQEEGPKMNRPSFGSNIMPISSPSLASLASLRPMQSRITSIPTHSVSTDPRAAFKNFTKFLNGGNSSEDSDESSSDSSSDDDAPPSKSRPSAVVKDDISQEEAVRIASSKVTSERTTPKQETAATTNIEAHENMGSPTAPALIVGASQDGEDVPEHLLVDEAQSTSQVEINPSPNGVLSFDIFNEDAHVTHQQSPSPEIPDFPTLMDQGGYTPHFSDAGYTSSHVRSEHPTSDAADADVDAMELDLLSPFKSRDPAQGIVDEGKSGPPEIAEYNSSPPPRSASASESQSEMDPHGVQRSMRGSPSPPPISPVPDEMQLDRQEQVQEENESSSSMDPLVAQLDHQEETNQGTGSSSPMINETEHHTDDDQAMASSQLLGEASVEPPSQQSQMSAVSESPRIRRSPQVVIHRSPTSVLANFQRVPVVSKADGAAESASENSRNQNADEDEESPGVIKDDDGAEDGKGGVDGVNSDDDPEVNPSDLYTMLPGSPSSPEWTADQNVDEVDAEAQTQAQDSTIRTKRKATGTTSRHFSTSPEKKKNKRVAGESSVPFPKLSAPRFGLIQETLWHNPFHMLCAVLFLNKTMGKAAKDIIFEVLERWPTPEALSKATSEELLPMIEQLGLHNERSKKLIRLAEIFVADPPQRARRHRTLHYPNHDDGKYLPDSTRPSVKHILEEDSDGIDGFLEIGHLYGTGPYAWDSWRIFCRDVLRGVARGYNGEGVDGYNPQDLSSQCAFEPEWKRVVPLDKELRACLRWMWLREGWDWDPLTGEKKPASVQKLREASQGIAEWNEPVPINPHGMDDGATDEVDDAQGQEVPFAAIKVDDIVETTEKPLQGVQDGTAALASSVARVTRSAMRSVPPAGLPDSQDNKRDDRTTAHQITQDDKVVSQRTRSTKSRSQNNSRDDSSTGLAEESVLLKTALPASRKRVFKDAQTPSAKAAKSTSVAASSSATPNKASQVSPRSIRKIKAKLAADYTASQAPKLALPVSISQPNPTRSPMDSPAKNTRQRSARVIESNTASSPPPPLRERRTVKAVKATTGRLLRTRMKPGYTGDGTNSRSNNTDESEISFVESECTENLQKIDSSSSPSSPWSETNKMLDNVQSSFPTVTAESDVVSNPVDDNVPATILSPNLQSTNGPLHAQTRWKRRVYREGTIVEPKPGFFNAAYDEAQDNFSSQEVNDEPFPHPSIASLNGRKDQLRSYIVSQGYGEPCITTEWDENKCWPEDQQLQRLRRRVQEAEECASAVFRLGLNHVNPNQMWRNLWREHYPQDVSTAIDAVKKGDLTRSCPQEMDVKNWCDAVDARDKDMPFDELIMWLRGRIDLPKKDKKDRKERRRRKWEKVDGDYSGDEQTRRFKQDLGKVDKKFERRRSPILPFALKVLSWDYRLTSAELRKLAKEKKHEEALEEKCQHIEFDSLKPAEQAIARKNEEERKTAWVCRKLAALKMAHGDDYVLLWRDADKFFARDEIEHLIALHRTVATPLEHLRDIVAPRPRPYLVPSIAPRSRPQSPLSPMPSPCPMGSEGEESEGQESVVMRAAEENDESDAVAASSDADDDDGMQTAKAIGFRSAEQIVKETCPSSLPNNAPKRPSSSSPKPTTWTTPEPKLESEITPNPLPNPTDGIDQAQKQEMKQNIQQDAKQEQAQKPEQKQESKPEHDTMEREDGAPRKEKEKNKMQRKKKQQQQQQQKRKRSRIQIKVAKQRQIRDLWRKCIA